MSGRAPQKPPKNARRIPTVDEIVHFARHDTDLSRIGPLLDGLTHLDEWLDANGFPFYIPQDPELYLSQDGRTLYGEKFLVRIARSGDHSRVPWWDYQTNRAGDALIRKRFAYPITRPLSWYAPDLAERLHLP